MKRNAFTLMELILVAVVVICFVAVGAPLCLHSQAMTNTVGAMTLCQKDLGRPCSAAEVIPKYLHKDHLPSDCSIQGSNLICH